MKYNFFKTVAVAFMAAVVSFGADAASVQPKIMVVPRTMKGEDVREKIESDPAIRIGLTKVREAFDQRGFTTVDFIAKVKAQSVANNMTEGAATDLKTEIINGSGADVYVDCEIVYTESSAGNDVKVDMTAYEISTGNSLANAVAMTNKFYTNDVAKLTAKAVEMKADDFLNTMQNKFDDIIENGRSIAVHVVVDEGSEVSLEDPIGNDGSILSDLLDEWMENNAYKGNYHMQGSSDKKIIFDDVHIALRDDNGNAMSTQKFARTFAKLFAKHGIKISRDVQNAVIYITIK